MKISRRVPSFFVAMVSAAAASAAAGIDFPAGDPAPSFVVPPVRAGDEGAYSSGLGEIRFRFAQADRIDENGQAERRLTLTQERTDQMAFTRDACKPAPARIQVWFEGSRVVAGTRIIDSDSGGTEIFFPYCENRVRSLGSFELLETRYDDSVVPFCGLVHSLQGGRLQDEAFLVSPGCGPALLSVSPGPTPGPSRAVDDAGLRGFLGEGVRVVLDRRFPVPVHVRYDGVDWNLTAFTRGPPAQAAIPSTKSYPIAFAEGRQPDETGIEHAFPLSEALSFALDGPLDNALRRFMSSDAHAYLADAAFTERVDDGQRTYAWTVTGSNGREAVAVVVEQKAAQADDTAAPLPVKPGVVLPAMPVPFVREVPAAQRAYPETDAPDGPWATLASLTGRWAAMAPEGAVAAGINAWGFSVRCEDPCLEPRRYTWVGIDRIREVNVTRVHVVIKDTLTVDETGRSTRFAHSDWDFSDRATVGGQSLVIRDGRNGDSSDSAGGPSATASSAFWELRPPAAAVAVTFLGVLSGLLYYAWPAISSGFVTLLRSARRTRGNAVRTQVLTTIGAAPGIHFQQLRRTLARAAGTLRHHLRVLEDQGDIVSQSVAGYRCYFPARGTSRHLLPTAGALKAASARRMLQRLVVAGPLSMGAAALAAGITPSTATHHALRLEAAGLITRVQRGRLTELSPTSLAAVALQSGAASPPVSESSGAPQAATAAIPA